MLECFESVMGDYAAGDVVRYEPVKNILLGENEDALRNIHITQLRYTNADFSKRLEREIRLTLVRKDVFDSTSNILEDFSPLFIVCEENNPHGEKIVTGMLDEYDSHLRAHLIDNYILLPFYITVNRKPVIYGLKHALFASDNNYSTGGKLITGMFRVVYIVAGGKRYTHKNYRYSLRLFLKSRMLYTAYRYMTSILNDIDAEHTIGCSYEV